MKDFEYVREEIKSLLKTRKIKYDYLASRLGLSESGIKKMLNSNDLSFNKISAILNVADVNVSEFFQTMEQSKPVEKSLTQKQEDFFLKNRDAYNFFYQLLSVDLDWKVLKERHGLTQKSIEKYLLMLDKIEVIELHPGNVVQSQYAGNCKLTYSMSLVKAVVDSKHRNFLDFVHIPNEKFKGRKHVVNGTLKLSSQSASDFNKALRDVVAEYMNKAKREKVVTNAESLEDIGFLIAVSPTAGMKPDVIPNV